MGQIKGTGTEDEEPGGPLIAARALRGVRREGKAAKAAGPRPAAAAVSTAGTSSRRTRAFHFPPFFPSFFSAPHMPDRTPGLPRARRPPAERAQRGSWRPRGRDGGSPQGPGSRAGPGPPAAREGLRARSRGPPREGRRGAWRFFILFFYMLQVVLVERGEKNFKFTSGRAPWGSRSNLRAGCLSAAAEKRIAQGLSLSRSWIKLQTQTPPFSTQQTVVANAAIWTLKTHYE